MASQKKLRKTDKKNHTGRGGHWLKKGSKVKGVSFFTPADRQALKREISQETE